MTDIYQEVPLTGDRWATINLVKGFAIARDETGTTCRLTRDDVECYIQDLESGLSGWSILRWSWYFQDPPRVTILPYGPGLLWVKCRLSLEDLKIIEKVLADSHSEVDKEPDELA